MAARAIPAPLAQIPNALTVARLILIPVFVVLLLNADGGHSWAAAIVFGVAGVTDQVDGWLARRWEVELRQDRRPARRPADDRRGRDPALAGGSPALDRPRDPGT
jgi:hypothetical protein